MTQINWGLAQNGGQNALSYFNTGMQMGQQARRAQQKRDTENAFAAYATNPNDPAAMAGLMNADPRLGMQAQQFQLRQAQQQQEAAQQAQKQKRADLPLMGRLLEGSTDEASYQQARAIAQEYGIDLSGAPANFDQAWRDSQLATVKALGSPEGQEALSTAGKIAMDMGLRPGTPEFNQRVTEIWQSGEAKPYVVGGETRLYTPRLGGTGEALGSSPPPAGTIEDGYRFKGGDPANPASWEKVGGPTQPASGGFRP